MNIIISRRSFLVGATAFSLAGCMNGRSGPLAGRPKLKIGVLSDIHITDWASTEVFRKTLRYYRDAGVDAVLIAGDLADHGLQPQLENVARAWYEVFPDDRGADGAKVEKLFVYGNHDPEGLGYRDRFMDKAFAVHGLSYEAAAKLRLTAIGLDKAWERCFREPYAPIYTKNVKGYDFVGAHWDTWNGVRGLEDWFRTNRSRIDTSRPFFYFQHAHPKDTVYGPWAWGHDSGQSTRALSPYPNAVAFSGHSHTTLTDERSVWRGAFTSVGTASLSYTCLEGPRDNADALNRETRERLSIRQGQLVNVYDDRIVIERRDFCRDEPIDTAWLLELPARASSFAARAARASVPAFPAGAVADIAFSQTGASDGKAVEGVTVSFPPALANPAARPYDYEVRLETRQADVELVASARRVYSPSAALPRRHDAEVKAAACAFARADLPKSGEYRFAVVPLDSYGVKGSAVYSPWAVPPAEKKRR